MNILSFDLEEWYVEKIIHGGRPKRFKLFDKKLSELLNFLDHQELKATFFCLGKLAEEYPQYIRQVADRGHEIGCHSHAHQWLNKMSPNELRNDLQISISKLEDICGNKVVSFRAPAFSIGAGNKWAFEILSECGIKNDASIFPADRDFGGFRGFPTDQACTIEYNGCRICEFPVSIKHLLGRSIPFSGGGYFRLIPTCILHSFMNNRDITVWYFHLADLISTQKTLLSKEQYEHYFKESGTLINRLKRYVKANIGTSDAYEKLQNLIASSQFVSIAEASNKIE